LQILAIRIGSEQEFLVNGLSVRASHEHQSAIGQESHISAAAVDKAEETQALFSLSIRVCDKQLVMVRRAGNARKGNALAVAAQGKPRNIIDRQMRDFPGLDVQQVYLAASQISNMLAIDSEAVGLTGGMFTDASLILTIYADEIQAAILAIHEGDGRPVRTGT